MFRIRHAGAHLALALPLAAAGPIASSAAPSAKANQIDHVAAAAMAGTGARGLAIAVIDRGQVVFFRTYGARDAAGDPLTPQTIMYGASLTKAVFGHLVMQLAQAGEIDLDTSIARYLPRPLPAYDDEATANRYARWSDLAGDERWRLLTPRMLLNHASGLANFGFVEPDGKLRFHFDPGTRYAYSGAGMLLLQFVLERGLGLDVQKEMQRRVFTPFGMTDSSLTWRPDFSGRVADGWTVDGKVQPHDQRSKPRVAGSMDTTICDVARFAAAYVRGDRLTPTSRRALTLAQRPITTASQFPTFQAELPAAQQRQDFAAGLGVVVFDGPQGHGFMKGGHDDITANTVVCLEAQQRCAVILSNDVRAERAFPALVRFVLGETGFPWSWEYSGTAFWRPAG